AAWLSLDEQDGDPVRFLTYLIHALQLVAPIGRSILQAFDTGSGSIDSALASLVNELDARDGEIVLVLDDYHEVDSPEIDSALQTLVARMPRSLRLVITSREDPPLALARMRARAQLAEVRADELRFSPGEVAAFLREAMGVDISDEQIRTLEERTEGWIAGLQLAAVSLQGETDVAGFVASFSASHRFVLDYLLEEVIERQPASVQRFLVQTSILDRFCASLCDAVLAAEPGSSAETLRYLERANLFLVSLDNDRRWYRYHHLFGELLRERAADPALFHDRASRWFEEHELPVEAFRHAAAAGDGARTLGLVYSGRAPLYFRGHVRPVLRWIESLPDSEREATPELMVHYAWVLWTAHRSAAAEGVLARLRGHDTLSPRARGLVAALRAMLASNAYDTETIEREAHVALELLGNEDSYVRLSVLRTLGVAHHYRGERARAHETYREVVERSRQSGDRFTEILTTTGLGMLEESELRLTEALRLHQHVIDLVGQPTQPVACASWLGLARIAYQRNDLEHARVWATRGVELAAAIEGIDVPVEGAVLLARIAYAEGLREQADALLTDATARAREHGYGVQLHAIARLRTRRFAIDGRVSDARDLIAEFNPGTLDQARVELAAGKHDAAAALLEPRLLDSAPDELAEASLLRAIMLESTDRHDEAIASMTTVIPGLRAEENVRILADEGGAIVPVLEACVRAGVEPEFATRVLAVLDASSPQAALASELANTGLSRRELEVLRLLAAGLSNTEIAARLFVSLSTVKGHTTHIYEKLGANRRTDAVARARERGLL
ncbi:MAG: LuxR C-terminal-related transcriptional regulator, partial [Spirochaetota bacterium]